ncbi:MAG: hypothetical protein AAFR76_14730 [Planctomycetota bacterium]
MGGTAAAFGAGQGILSTGLSITQADANNDAIDSQIARERSALGFETAAVNRRAANRSGDIRRASAEIEGRLRVLEAFSGGGGIGFDRVRGVNAFETGLNLGRIEQEADEQIASLRISRLGNVSALRSGQQSAILAGLAGGLGGLSSGLALGSQIQGLRR